MINLYYTTDKIQVVLNAAVTANQLHCYSSFRDIGANSHSRLRNAILTNGTTPVDVVDTPASDIARIVEFLSIYNADTENATVTVLFNANGTTYVLHRETLEPSKTLIYADQVGFYVEGEAIKSVKSFTFHGDAGANFVMTNATLAERFALNATRHLFMVDLEGYTQVRLRANVQVLSASVNTPLFRVKYCVGWSTTVGNFLQIGASGHCQISLAATGYIDTGWITLAAGARVNGVTIGCTELGGDGAADPALGATDILFR